MPAAIAGAPSTGWKREQRQHLRRVLGQTAVTHLDVTELPLDHPEGMLDLGAQAGLATLPALNLLALPCVSSN